MKMTFYSTYTPLLLEKKRLASIQLTVFLPSFSEYAIKNSLAKANTAVVLNDTQKRLFPELQKRYPELKIALKSEVESSAETNNSIFLGFILALAGVFLLLSL
jgi:hypothetical protein